MAVVFSVSASTAVAVERAGLSEAFDTGMATRWNSTSARPIAIGAKPAGAPGEVTLTITIRNSAVMTISIRPAERIDQLPEVPAMLETASNVLSFAPAG